MIDPKDISLNTATVKQQWDLRGCIEGCARHGLGGIGPWRSDLDDIGTKEAAKIIQDHGLRVTGLCRGGFFPALNKEEKQKRWDDNRLAVDQAVGIGAECLVLVVGGLPISSKDLAAARAQVKEGMAELLQYSRSCQMPLALEPFHPMYAADRACVSTLAQANDLCEELGEGLGIAYDLYHLWWDPNLEEETKRAGDGRILALHLADWLNPTTDMLLDRGMMGDGVIEISKLCRWARDTGYGGMNEIEIFSQNNWWKRDPDEVLKIIKDRCQST